LVQRNGNRYQVDPLLVGRKVELVFDPFDLTNIRVRADGTDHGRALPHQISRHAHPKARPETPPETPQATTGIDYLGLVDAEHTATIAARVNYAALTGDEQPDQGPRT
jgi:putative transposase